ncbi:MAG: glycosyltransferase family 4 protein [Candidatus Binatia bacterium]
MRSAGQTAQLRPARRLRIGLIADAIVERRNGDRIEIANGGVGVYFDRLVRELLELDAADLVLFRSGPAGLEIFGDPRLATIRSRLPRWLHWTRWVDFRFAALARRYELDLVHYPNQFGGAFLDRGVRRVMTLHDLTPLAFPRFHPRRAVAGYRLLLERSLGRADAVIVGSEAVRRELLDLDPGLSDRIATIPQGVSTAFRPDRRTPDFLRRFDLPERFVLSVGVLEPRKNHATLVKALARLHAAGERIGLVIAGRDGWRWRDPLADTRFAALRPWVRVLRNVPEDHLVELYGRAAAFAYPSFAEGFGLPLLEAMACGCPVVASNAAALREVGGGAALYAPATDDDALAERLLSLLRDPGLRRSSIERGFTRAAEFTWRRTAERTLGIYERVARSRVA